jgi:hypothetical protein
MVFRSVGDPVYFGPPGSDPLVRGRDPDPAPKPDFVTKQNSMKKLESYCFMTFYF